MQMSAMCAFSSYVKPSDGRQAITLKLKPRSDRRAGVTPVLGAAQAERVPLVGVWVAGVATPQSPHVWAAALRFLCSPAIVCRALSGDGTFLVLVCCEGNSHSLSLSA